MSGENFRKALLSIHLQEENYWQKVWKEKDDQALHADLERLMAQESSALMQKRYFQGQRLGEQVVTRYTLARIQLEKYLAQRGSG